MLRAGRRPRGRRVLCEPWLASERVVVATTRPPGSLLLCVHVGLHERNVLQSIQLRFPAAAAPCSILLRCPAPAHNPDPTLWPAVVRTSSTRRKLSRGWSLADSRRWSTPRPSWPRSSSAAPACCRCAGGPPSWRGCSGPFARRPSPVARRRCPLSSTAHAHARSRTQVCAKCVIPTVSG